MFYSQCFGLLGVNGAGKSTTFKILNGEIPPSSGYAVIRTSQGYDPNFIIFPATYDDIKSNQVAPRCPAQVCGNKFRNTIVFQMHFPFATFPKGWLNFPIAVTEAQPLSQEDKTCFPILKSVVDIGIMPTIFSLSMLTYFVFTSSFKCYLCVHIHACLYV